MPFSTLREAFEWLIKEHKAQTPTDCFHSFYEWADGRKWADIKQDRLRMDLDDIACLFRRRHRNVLDELKDIAGKRLSDKARQAVETWVRWLQEENRCIPCYQD